MNTLEFYAVEVRKHGMTYGQYESAIRNGERTLERLEVIRRGYKTDC